MSEDQTNMNSIGQVGELGTQPWESFTKTSIPINENIDWSISQELDINPLPIRENITYNRYELKLKKQKKWLHFLLWILVGILLCLCYALLLNNNWISNSIADTINSLSNKIEILSNRVNSIVIDKTKLSWTYATDDSKYTIDFNGDNTLRWRQYNEIELINRVEWDIKPGSYFPEFKQEREVKGYESFFDWTYEYNNWEYILYVKWWYLAADTVFHATPQSDWSLRIVGWTVHNELFRKKS